MDKQTQEGLITKTLIEIRNVEEKFRKILENPALYGAENGLTNEQVELLGRLISLAGEANLAADVILKKL